MKGTCLLGETSGYVVDAKASRSLLEVLTSRLRIKIAWMPWMREQKTQKC
ncbi:MAG: hypothetical protein ACM3X1_05260 [Ignavibacteriales bacterium]